MNKIVLIGNLTADPETRNTQQGIVVCQMKIAVNRRHGEGTDFFNVTAWRQLAENCTKFLSKGKKIAVSGALQTRSYEDKQGVKRTAYEIVADDVEFLTPRTQESQEAGTELPDDCRLPF